MFPEKPVCGQTQRATRHKIYTSVSLSVLTATFQGEPWLAGFIEAKNGGSGSDNQSNKT